MQCDSCGCAEPTRFVIFGKAMGFVVLGFWQQRAESLCEECLKKRFDDWTGATGLAGWRAVKTFGRAVRFVGGNQRQLRRARRERPIRADATATEVLREREHQARRLLLYQAAALIYYGGLVAAFGALHQP